MNDHTGYLASLESQLREAQLQLAAKPRWLPIEQAPKDFSPIMALARGADDRPLYAIVRWGCVTHAFSSFHHCSEHPSEDCEFEWLGGLMQYKDGAGASRFGVPFTDFHYLLQPPEGYVSRDDD